DRGALRSRHPPPAAQHSLSDDRNQSTRGIGSSRPATADGAGECAADLKGFRKQLIGSTLRALASGMAASVDASDSASPARQYAHEARRASTPLIEWWAVKDSNLRPTD